MRQEIYLIPSAFNISSMIKQTDPQLWHFLKLATSGKYDHKSTTDHGKQNRHPALTKKDKALN
jgi:hypothetical protein